MTKYVLLMKFKSETGHMESVSEEFSFCGKRGANLTWR